MSPARRRTEAMTPAELLALPATVDVATAARALGIGRTLAQELIAGNRDTPFPATVRRLGNSQRVITVDLVRAVLGDAAADRYIAAQATPPTDTPGVPGAPQ